LQIGVEGVDLVVVQNERACSTCSSKFEPAQMLQQLQVSAVLPRTDWKMNAETLTYPC
jgi:hypothetical protein